MKNMFFFNIIHSLTMDDEQYLENICTIIEDSMINRVNEFEQAIIKNDKVNDLYELNNLILQRHFLIKRFEEINL